LFFRSHSILISTIILPSQFSAAMYVISDDSRSFLEVQNSTHKNWGTSCDRHHSNNVMNVGEYLDISCEK
jgi:hypothetical protein